MSYAQIISGGTDGRYEIELDYGSAKQAAVLAGIAPLIPIQEAKIVAAQVKVDAADAQEAAQRVVISVAVDDFVAEASGLPPGSPLPSQARFQFEVKTLRQMEVANSGKRTALKALKAALVNLLKLQTYWTNIVTINRRGAWCVDLTEDLTGYVATADIPGESDLVLVLPRAWSAADGIMTAREIMPPPQAYFNAAILPGWQKDKPTYRWGTITSILRGQNTCDVELFEATSSAQSLNVNQTPTLSAVPIEYMTCDCAAFRVGDRVVVEFENQSWDDPKVIGFLDTPRECNWEMIGILGAPTGDRPYPVFVTRHRQDIFDIGYPCYPTIERSVVEYRINGGAWDALYTGGLLNNHSFLRNVNFTGTNAAPGTPLVNLNIYDHVGAGGGGIEDITTSVLPAYVEGIIWVNLVYQTPVTSKPPYIAEFRAIVGGELLFNFAVKYTADLVSPPGPLYVKSMNGLSTSWDPGISHALWSYETIPGYVLFGEE